MKRNLIFVWSCLAGIAYATAGYAQKVDPIKDQNPRYQESRAKYLKLTDSLNRDQGSTVQDTYKAYDWYEAREERRKLRRERNFQLNLNGGYYYGSPYFYPSISYGNYGFGGRFGYGGYIGYGFGNSRPWYGW
ncbi:MAG: hypothetical protein P0Y49_21620 [Candidatus Pedobacter colombiensis]|uniref:Uncharacterized protein n=1 Tax=Candidatus Pedobacter colombiensis TaxID=3121371 RepID=A0AAJ5WAS7_9SPHI|nr:hypothetical protein [Pedobacter sp.]WEK19377.1 MAG: hypothetical protein P0Y49_21620 [Pedobacter sp.]